MNEEYKAQLKQINAALNVDPDSEKLKSLKADLEELISLTVDKKEEVKKKVTKYSVGDLITVQCSELTKLQPATITSISKNGFMVLLKNFEGLGERKIEEKDIVKVPKQIHKPKRNRKTDYMAKRKEEQERLDLLGKETQQNWLNFASGTTKRKKAAISSLNPLPILKKKSLFSTK